MLNLCLSLVILFSVHTADHDVIVDEIFYETNQYRRSQKLDTLVFDTVLSALAQQHSENMARGKEKFGHGGFEKRVKQAQKELPALAFAENVYMNPEESSGKTAVEAWIASKGHRENMKNKAFKRIGIGVAESKDGSFYFTQIFSD